MSKKAFTSIAGASIVVIILSIISKGFGFFREIIFAYNYGLDQKYDLFLIGAVIPVYLTSVITFLGQNFFIPVHKKIKIISDKDSFIFLNNSIFIFLAGGILISILLFLFSENIIELFVISDLSAKQFALKIFRLMLITIPLSCISSIISAYLQSEYDYYSPLFSLLIINISVIIVVLIFTKQINVYSIAYGFLLGNVVQFLFLFFKIKKIFSFKHISNFEFIKNFSFNILIITTFIEALGQLFLIIDRMFYNSIESGGIAALNYALNIYILPLTIFSMAFSSVLFPKLTHSFYEKNTKQLNDNLNAGININTFVIVPIAFIFFFFGDSIIEILFQRGEFKIKETVITFNILKYLSISLIFYSAYAIVNKILFGVGEYKFLLMLYLSAICLKIIFSFLFITDMKQNGLALSSSICYIFLFIASYFYLTKKINSERKMLIFSEMLISVLVGLLSFAIFYIISLAIKSNDVNVNLLKIFAFISIYVFTSFKINRSYQLLFKDIKSRIKEMIN